jgi:hypothetical protein
MNAERTLSGAARRCCIAAILLWASASARGQGVTLRLLQEFPDGYGSSIAADADHDGRWEVHGSRYVPPNTGDYDVLERSALNGWSLVSRQANAVSVNDGGDSDQDGRFEILRLSLANGLEVLESIDPSSFPSQLVYTNPNIGFFQTPARFADDLDRDGRREILYTFSNPRPCVVILENTGDNAYAEVARPEFSTTGASPGYVTSGDFDGDGWGDILVGDNVGNLFVIESRGDDAYELVWQWDLLTPYNTKWVVALGDADGDGRGEFAAVTHGPDRLWIFESVGDDQYVPIFTHTFLYGTAYLTCGDIDGDGRNELLVGAGRGLQIWRVVADDHWEMIWETAAAGRAGPRFLAADLNNNGFGEVFFTCCHPDLDRSYLMEWPFRVDASQNDLDHPGDAIFTFRDIEALRRIRIGLGPRDITRRVIERYRMGDPRVTVAVDGDETVLRLDLPALGAPSARNFRMSVSARDRQTGEAVEDRFTYVAP